MHKVRAIKPMEYHTADGTRCYKNGSTTPVELWVSPEGAQELLRKVILDIRESFLDESCPTIELIGGGAGLCADFADAVWSVLGGPDWIQITDDEVLGRVDENGTPLYTHTFLEAFGQYWDAETPEGVKHWRDFPLVARQRAEGTYVG